MALDRTDKSLLKPETVDKSICTNSITIDKHKYEKISQLVDRQQNVMKIIESKIDFHNQNFQKQHQSMQFFKDQINNSSLTTTKIKNYKLAINRLNSNHETSERNWLQRINILESREKTLELKTMQSQTSAQTLQTRIESLESNRCQLRSSVESFSIRLNECLKQKENAEHRLETIQKENRVLSGKYKDMLTKYGKF